MYIRPINVPNAKWQLISKEVWAKKPNTRKELFEVRKEPTEVDKLFVATEKAIASLAKVKKLYESLPPEVTAKMHDHLNTDKKGREGGRMRCCDKGGTTAQLSLSKQFLNQFADSIDQLNES